MSLDHSSRIVLVTGASREPGAAVARHLTESGAHVVTCDAHDTTQVRAALADVSARHGRLDALVSVVAGGEDPQDVRAAGTAATEWMASQGHGAIVYVRTP